MLSAQLETSRHDRAGASATPASCRVSRSNQHQARSGFVARRSLRVAGHNPQYDWSALCRAGFVQCGLTLSRCSTFMISYLARASVRVLSPHPHWLGFSSLTSHRPASRILPHRGVGQHSPERAFTRCAGAFPSVRISGANRSRAHTLLNQQQPQRLAGSVHLSAVLSSIASSVKAPWTEGMPISCQSLPKWSVK